jgi:trigger factor
VRVEITDLSGCKKQVSIEVPADKVSEQYNRVSVMIAQNANIPGFRRGKAPASVIKTRFKKEIRDQVMRDLLPEALHSAVTDNNLAMVGEPSIDELTLDDGKPLVFKAKIEVLPEVEVKEYAGLKANKKIRIITDEMVNKKIDELREQHATLIPVEDREARDGDFATFHLSGKFLDQEAEGMDMDDLSFEIGDPKVQKEFNETARGMKVGEERSFKVTYEQDHQNQRLAGHEMEYTLKLDSLKAKELPELDDEFAQGLGEYENVEDLKRKIREQFEAEAGKEADERVREELLNQLVDQNEFEVPDVLVERQMNDRVLNFQRMLRQHGVDPRTVNFNWGETFQAQRKGATRDVRSALIIERIAEKENIDVTEQELDEEITRMATMFGMPVEATKSRLTKDDAIDSIKGRLRSKKALDFVISSAEIVEERVSAEELDRHEAERHAHEHEHDEHEHHEHEHHEHHEGCEHDEHGEHH